MAQRQSNNRKRQSNNRKRKNANQKNKSVAMVAQGQARKIGQEYHKAAITGLVVSSRSVSEFNRGLQEFTEEMADYSKQALRAWERLLDARPFGRLFEIQTRFIQSAYEAYASEASRVGELYRTGPQSRLTRSARDRA